MKVGDILEHVFICNDCCYRQGFEFKKPSDSGNKSLFCKKCEHFNLGSYYKCLVVDWLRLKVIK
jgi:hypothetical protein